MNNTYDTTVISNQVNSKVRNTVYENGILRNYDMNLSNTIGDLIRKNLGFIIQNKTFWMHSVLGEIR